MDLTIAWLVRAEIGAICLVTTQLFQALLAARLSVAGTGLSNNCIEIVPSFLCRITMGLCPRKLNLVQSHACMR